ncbi:MAG: UDP-N-acetylmuramoylalanine--D-glutamate ligase [Lysobacterales bacterium]|jgi:UDP-N-acetylmuramoylalanine--D-glutamate ligase
MLLSELANKSIGILGSGREGQAAWRWLRMHFPQKLICIYDEGPANATHEAIFDGPDDRLINGPFEIEQLAVHDVLIRSPGISPYRGELLAIKARGIRFTSASNLWFTQHPKAKTICITGTKGKSTTASLVTHLLSGHGFKVQLAGNIGQPLLGCNDFDVDWWVIELSSYQLVDLDAKPHVAVILNLSDEHLDWHGGSQAYQDDKLKITRLQADHVLANSKDDLLFKRLSEHGEIRWFGNETGFHVKDNTLWDQNRAFRDIPRDSLRGRHNLANLAAALSVLRIVGLEVENPAASLSTFKALPHRLQPLGRLNGIYFINDSLSTTPIATLAALEALQEERIILLAGGMDRGLDWRPYVPQIKELSPYAVICLPDNGSKIEKVLKEEGFQPEGGIQCAADLSSAMKMLPGLARQGDTVLLSPGAPSFPHFRDYEDRGKQFAQLAGL